MRCQKCRTENQSSLHKCSECGTVLKATLPKRKLSVPWYWLVICILGLGGAFFLSYHFFLSNRPTAQVIQNDAIIAHSPEEKTGGNVGYVPVFGSVIIQNAMAEEVARIEAVVFNGSWIILPTCFVYSGNKWIYRDQFGEEVGIKGGIWNTGDPVGLWQLDNSKEYSSPKLAAWEKGSALLWHQSGSEGPARTFPLSSLQKQGAFTSFNLPGYIKKPGVIYQKDKIVGWTFGRWLKRGFLWDGPGPGPTKYEILVTDFINSTASICQEAQFSRALVMRDDISAADRLFALADGFQYEPQFRPQDKHDDLLPKTIAGSMHTIATELLQNEQAQDIIDILDDQVLQAASDRELFKDKIQAIINQYDYRRAIQYFERTRKILFPFESEDPPVLEELHIRLYKDWIVKTIADTNTPIGWVAFNAAKRLFPDDPELHLLGVELAVSEKDWNRAEELLVSHPYPQPLLDRARTLEILILEKKGEEGKVVIRFTPGAKQIWVEAQLNGRKTQQFIIDTGASQVTIPSETAHALGIAIDDETPVIPVSTASGIELAYEVELDSIELQGMRVHNIKTLILDIPSMPQLGLLGANFLEHFQVEIDSTRGVLRLKRR